MDERVNDLLPLAAKIAREFGNIPGLPFAEIELSAQEALANAARLFDPEKGDFTPYAARAMRNALCDLYTPTERPMSAVHLHVRSSDGTSKSFTLSEHDTFLLGRMDDCHLCVPGDPQVSRHHFLLEVCPPKAALRDLGSMNGTHLNFPKPVSDVWSFAASLYQLLTGKFPYRFDPKRDPIDIILNENPVPIRERMPKLNSLPRTEEKTTSVA